MFLNRTALTVVALSAATLANAHAAGVGALPNLPVVSPILNPVLGGGAGGGGGGGIGGGGGGLGDGVSGGGSTSLFGDSASWDSASARGKTSWGDPLGAELFGTDKIKAKVHYYGDAGSQRSEQAVGLTLSIAN